MSARAIVSGVLFKAPIEKASKTGNPFATFPIRENHNGATRWWQGITFDKTAIAVLQEISVGEPIAVAGEITAEIYAPAGSESRINWRITIDAVLSARKVKPEVATRKPQAAKGRRDRAEASSAQAEASNTGGSALAAASWPMNDDIPFAPEWR
jgi:Single-strand binding protein family